jgi:hypothetical protein
MRDLVRHDRSPASYLVYLYVYRQTHGEGRAAATISYAALADATGLSKRSGRPQWAVWWSAACFESDTCVPRPRPSIRRSFRGSGQGPASNRRWAFLAAMCRLDRSQRRAAERAPVHPAEVRSPPQSTRMCRVKLFRHLVETTGIPLAHSRLSPIS